MNPLNPLFAITVFLIAYFTGHVIGLKYKPDATIGRYQTIDGLRGFLALSVFIHHASIWYQFIHSDGQWEAPKSNLYNQLGKTGVTLFFMITSFLFVSKLLNSDKKEFNWKHFFRSRMVRIFPLYYFSVLLIIIIAMTLSHWKLNVSLSSFAASIFNWMIFTMNGDNTINNVTLTNLINAGVIWSLPWEWLFYFSLPLIALFILKRKPSIVFILLSMIFMAFFFYLQPNKIYAIYSFIGGAIASVLLKYTNINTKVECVLSSCIVIICFLLIGKFNSSDNDICILLIIIVFTFIAIGNSMFGLLNNSTLKLLGDISYSTYLLHGIILFTILYLGIGVETLKQFSTLYYWIIIFTITPIVVIISFLGYRLIEKPFMNRFNKSK